jgi:ribokinase
VKPEGILIAGSLNMDFVVRVEQLPQRGQTVPGAEFKTLPGGKGANQACAVGRLSQQGRNVRMVGCVGADSSGEQLKASLRAANVDVTYVRTTTAAATGVALITVEQSGQNQIVVAAGANECLQPEEVIAAIDAVAASHLLLQLESPLQTVVAAARHARACGMQVILDPAPARPLDAALLADVDILTPNESEARALLRLTGSDISLDEAPDIARQLLALGPRRVILKLGDKGVWLADETCSQHFAAPRVEAVDVTAAGDCFNGALAAALAEGQVLTDAIHFATTAATLAVTKPGAQDSIPTRARVEAMLQARSARSVIEVENA